MSEAGRRRRPRGHGTVTRGWGEGWSLASMRGQRKVRAAQSGVPGESRGGGRRPVDSPDRHAGSSGVRATETTTAGSLRRAGRGEKGNPPCSNLRIGRQRRWLAEAGSREQSRRRRRDRPCGAERDDHHEQNSAYSLSTIRGLPRHHMVPLAQLAEHRPVEPRVAGSSPVRHPQWKRRPIAGRRFAFLSACSQSSVRPSTPVNSRSVACASRMS